VHEIGKLINKQQLMPLYLTFGEKIDDFEALEQKTFDPQLHITYFKSMLLKPPSQYSSMDVQRMTLLFFSAFGLSLLTGLPADNVLAHHNEPKSSDEKQLVLSKQNIIDWIYAQQIIPEDQGLKGGQGGLRGGSFLGL
ncbi:hypothetical protein RFI_33606, partial [Reticulomyxa filosa]